MFKSLQIKKCLLLAAMVLGAGTAWAADYTYTFEAKQYAGAGDQTLNGVSWTMAGTGGAYFGYSDTKGQPFGSGSNPYSALSLTTSDISGTITSIVVNTSGASSINGTVAVSVGETAFKCDGNTTVNLTATATEYTFTGDGSGDIVISWTQSSSKAIYVKSIGVTYTSKSVAGVSASNIDMITGTTKADFYTAPVSGYDGTLSFASTDETVAKVEGGVLKAIAPGTATITISAAETTNFAAVNVPFTVTVKNRDAVSPEGASASGGYALVTDASTLADGDKIILVNGTAGKAMGAQSGNFRSVTDVTISGTTIATISDDVKVITLEGAAGAWYFHASDGYLYASSSSANNMGTEAEKDDNAKATISIDDESGDATIVFQGTNTRNHMRYNASNPRFSCYAETSSVVDLPQIYRMVDATEFDVTIGSTGWRTLVSAKNVSLPSGVKAYTVTASSASSVTLTEVASIKANNAYLLNGTAGDYTLTIIDTPAEPTGNLLKIADASTGNGVYVLYNKDGEAGFYKWNGGSLGAGRVYLDAPAGARDFLTFTEETTGIETVKAVNNNRYYNLQGVEVAQPTKGLYIVNGKKVLVK